MVKAFIFDLDGVITDTAALHFTAWSSLAKEINITIDHTFNTKLKGLSRIDSLKTILKEHNRLHQYTAEELEFLAEEKNKHYVQLIATLTPKHILPGILDLLRELKTNKYKIGLASSSQNAGAILERLELLHYFDIIANPTLIKSGKPAPDIFLLAASLLNVSPDLCIGIEDAESGIHSIKQAGMVAVGVGKKDQLPHADYVCSTTYELTLPRLLHVWTEKR
ncbi:beta-phosphoglucomutase [Pseudogracilibacillus sp. SE30717A]|uniref:beta-phosphoglucomutase n=1 Tax=Pseudogracilibacillus sp. SE30717A TaxID=3098293 RepID=UPI00300DD6A2